MSILRAHNMKPPPGSLVDPTHQLGNGVAYWLLNEGRGKQVTDVGPYRNHGVLTNMDPITDWVAELHGYALDFDGSNDHVVASGSVIDETKEVSVSAWVKVGSGTSDTVVWFRNSGGFSIKQHGDSGNYLHFVTGGTSFGADATRRQKVPALDGEWHHIVGVASSGSDKTVVAAYMDGQQMTDTAGGFWTAGTATNEIIMGSRNGGAAPFDGSLRCVFVLNRIVTADEAAWLYHEPYSMIVAPDPARFFSLPAVGVDELGATFVQGGHFMEYRAGSVRAA